MAEEDEKREIGVDPGIPEGDFTEFVASLIEQQGTRFSTFRQRLIRDESILRNAYGPYQEKIVLMDYQRRYIQRFFTEEPRMSIKFIYFGRQINGVRCFGFYSGALGKLVTFGRHWLWSSWKAFETQYAHNEGQQLGRRIEVVDIVKILEDYRAVCPPWVFNPDEPSIPTGDILIAVCSDFIKEQGNEGLGQALFEASVKVDGMEAEIARLRKEVERLQGVNAAGLPQRLMGYPFEVENQRSLSEY